MLGSLQSHELRIKQFDSSASEQDFQVQDSNHVSLRGRGEEDHFMVNDKEEGMCKVKIKVHIKDIFYVWNWLK